ncbi:hypothetical protein BDB01DRAFT_541829 [Pilobolus umbonatus]|nr:hypothetical protein BDB01DRAFT_541829 [Pilobolus umbonatus]
MNNNTKSNNKSKAELKSRILSKNFLPRHLEPFTTSKSTTSLPDLLKNVASSTTNTSRLVIDSTVDLSTPMKRGNSYQMTPNNNTMEDLKRKAYAIIHNNTLQNTSFYSNEKDFTCSVRDRRHSFSSFLNVKYGKAAKSKAASEYKVKLVTSPHTQTHSVNKQIPSQISHRPRSYSE